ncbi:DUF6990 domain-containing protein [Basilea psittacipulmonis]|uniref:DUF4304 domain-containing protein n=1 Tax=Basilea psittacipulmonis DSM 24701 TaxID=1072685 RepID=A0A077DJF1_9BURK|nr:hypothetical protein [Basilea psittacipulmonis]AIL33218.1 hypothetical protein IX83_07850 [Basilea psittacipulmonis DSM 24701]
MNFKELKSRLVASGWKFNRGDGTVDCRSFSKCIDGKLVELHPRIRKESMNKISLVLFPSISTERFMQTRNFLLQIEEDYYPLVARSGVLAPPIEKGVPEEIFPELTEEIVDELLEESIAWAKYQSVDKALAYYANLPTYCGGAAVEHLTALILRKEKEKILYYREIFSEAKKGKMRRFLPGITEDIMNRAVSLVMKEE